MNDWISIVKARMEVLGITQEQMAERVDVTQGAVGHWLGGRREPKLADINRMLEVVGMPPLSVSASQEDIGSNVTLASQPDRYFRYPVVSSVVAGGWGDVVQPYEPGAEDRSELSDYKAKGRAFWLEVDGDSMTAPSGQSIPEGMLILVDTGIEAQPGHLVVAKLDSEEKATFKKLVNDAGQLYLKPLNPAYRMIPINGNCRFIGVVKEAKMKL